LAALDGAIGLPKGELISLRQQINRAVIGFETPEDAKKGCLTDQSRTPRKPLAGRTVKDIQFLGIGIDAQEAVYERMGIKAGDVLSNESMDRAQEGLRQLDPKIQFKVLSVGDAEALVILFRETARR
jgi:hypothetical protein